jgi:hypothetical protein
VAFVPVRRHRLKELCSGSASLRATRIIITLAVKREFMGASGVGLFQHDVAVDVRSRYRDLLAGGASDAEAFKTVVREWKRSKSDRDCLLIGTEFNDMLSRQPRANPNLSHGCRDDRTHAGRVITFAKKKKPSDEPGFRVLWWEAR